MRFVDHVDFGATDPDRTLGRWPDADPSGRLFPMTRPTFGQANSGPVAGAVVISELHYHPDPNLDDGIDPPLDSEQFEFVELIGATDHRVDLSGWRIDGAVAFQFAAGATIGPRETVVLVSFDPVDPLAVAFRERFGIAESVALLGPYTDRLGNGGDDVQLVRPAEPGSPTTGFVLVDRVRYNDQPPWPVTADGGGHALERTSLDAYGDLAASWGASDPTPGSSGLRVAGDMNFDGVVNGRDVMAFVLALSDPATYLATYGVPVWYAGDLDGDGDLDFDDIGGFVAVILGRVP